MHRLIAFPVLSQSRGCKIPVRSNLARNFPQILAQVFGEELPSGLVLAQSQADAPAEAPAGDDGDEAPADAGN